MGDRGRLRAAVAARETVLAPLCLDPLSARLCEELGFDTAYLSGGALGYSLAVSEALLTVSELAAGVSAITKRSGISMVADIGVGFGDPVHVARAVWELEAAGAAAVEVEDQVAPKRVSHHRGIEHLVPTSDMVAKIRTAVASRRDPDLLVIARTGAVRHEGFEAALERGRAFFAAGADLVLLSPQADDEWRSATKELPGPVAVLARLDARPAGEWRELGYALVLDPFTGQVVAFDALQRAYQAQLNGQKLERSQEELDAIYHRLPAVAGLEPLYDIERATTEPGT
ncbi:MAG: isocitrate lyase/phosphoenolpyruvate mutase family protein [Acidimicrobiales bacterium]|nr:isocitrate lyase/phosphoenolpyruvate mutase family protein [Acidimicrobiales bacterium]